jgi:hypothetical protein
VLLADVFQASIRSLELLAASGANAILHVGVLVAHVPTCWYAGSVYVSHSRNMDITYRPRLPRRYGPVNGVQQPFTKHNKVSGSSGEVTLNIDCAGEGVSPACAVSYGL